MYIFPYTYTSTRSGSWHVSLLISLLVWFAHASNKIFPFTHTQTQLNISIHLHINTYICTRTRAHAYMHAHMHSSMHIHRHRQTHNAHKVFLFLTMQKFIHACASLPYIVSNWNFAFFYITHWTDHLKRGSGQLPFSWDRKTQKRGYSCCNWCVVFWFIFSHLLLPFFLLLCLIEISLFLLFFPPHSRMEI